MTEPQSGTPISDRMQSLFAQAAEDQLSEQRALSDALTEVRGQLGQITSDVAALRGQVQTPATIDTSAVDTAVGAVSAEVREAVRLIGERLDSLARMVHQRGLDIAELRGSVGEVQQTANEPAAVVTELGGKVTELGGKVSQLGENVNELTGNMSELSGQFGSLRESIATLQDSLQQETERNFGLGEQMLALSGQNSAVGEQISALTDQNSGLGEQLSALTGQFDAVAGTADAARSDNEALQRRLDGMQEDITAIGGNVAGLVESGVDPDELRSAMQAAHDALAESSRMNEVAVQIADVRASLLGDDGLEAQVAGLKQQIADIEPGADEDALDERISATVTAAVSDSEHRLMAYLDDAVLALAEVLLRRRPPSRVSAGFAVRRMGEPAVAAAAASAAFASSVADPDVVDEDVSATGIADLDEVDDMDDFEVDDVAATDEVLEPEVEPESSSADGDIEATATVVDLPAAPDIPGHGLTAPVEATDDDVEEQSEADRAPWESDADVVDHDVPAPWDLPSEALASEPTEAVETADSEPEFAEPEVAADELDQPVETPDETSAEPRPVAAEPEWHAEVTPDPKRKRKPWWRPGD